MKLKKILASILCVAMVLSTMSFSVFAEDSSKGNLYSCCVNTENPDGTFITTETWGIDASESIELKIYDAENNLLATTTAMEQTLALKGSVSIFTGINCEDPDWWTTTWTTMPNANNVPAKAELYIDGDMTSELEFEMKSYLNQPIDWADVKGVFGVNRVEAENEMKEDDLLAQSILITFNSVPCIDENMTVQLYHDDELLSTTNIAEKRLGQAYSALTANVIYSGDAAISGSWTTEINAPWTIDRAPNKIVVNIDGIETTFTNFEIAAFSKFEKFDLTTGTITSGYATVPNVIGSTSIWGEGGANAKESFVVELYAEDEKIGQASLNDYEDIIDGDLYVTWSIPYDGADSNYWTVDWYGNNPSVDTMPTKVVLVVDGVKVAENIVKMCAPDDLNPIEWNEIESIPVAARIGKTGYSSVEAAIVAAEENDTITIFAGTYNAFEVPADKNNLTFVGETDADGNNLVTIRTMEDDIDTVTKGVHTKAENVTFRNLDFVSGTVGIPLYNGNDRSWMTSAIGVTNGSVGAPSSGVKLQNLTIENCNFTGSGVYNAIWATKANVTVKDSTITNYEIGIEAYNLQGTKKLEVINSEITNAPNALHTAGDGGIVVMKETKIVESGIALGGANANVSVTDSEFYNSWFKTYNANAVANISNNLFINSDVSETSKGTYNGMDIEANYADAMAALGAVNEMIPTKLTVNFKYVEDGLYNIVLSSYDDIYEFVGAELTFQNFSTTAAGTETVMNYEILGIDGTTNAEKSIEKADTYALRLVDGAERMSGNDLVIGKVKFYGQGDITFTVSAGKVVTTEYGTNLGQYYTLDADDTTADTLSVVGITNNKVEEVTRNVVVNVAYNLGLDGTYWKDSEGNVANQITVTLKDGFGNIYGPFDVSDEIESIPNVKLGRLTVTLEAPGFRKYVYNTTLEAGADESDALVLNFWNNVKRNEELNGVVVEPLAEIETGKGFMAHNFVVGDIVMDYIVDEYDLAAVTSYYGMYDLPDADKYIKYDLNRDGNIDITDVHYVLHTLNK